ncbi:hypothetical protein E0K93_09550 [Puniceibacterium sp. HSS470]|nr:hypothetical protein E0K93_09550 [Puniceibacterium sp. HSS470]|tara:strand:- start:9515 stop:10132 length:618 start_codon:yes stop_codon:yes gene_type:complete
MTRAKNSTTTASAAKKAEASASKGAVVKTDEAKGAPQGEKTQIAAETIQTDAGLPVSETAQAGIKGPVPSGPAAPEGAPKSSAIVDNTPHEVAALAGIDNAGRPVIATGTVEQVSPTATAVQFDDKVIGTPSTDLGSVAEVEDGVEDAAAIVICHARDGRRRGGRRFAFGRTELAEAELSDALIEALQGDPEFMVVLRPDLAPEA